MTVIILINLSLQIILSILDILKRLNLIEPKKWPQSPVAKLVGNRAFLQWVMRNPVTDLTYTFNKTQLTGIKINPSPKKSGFGNKLCELYCSQSSVF